VKRINSYIEDINNASKMNKLTIFIGAGVSKISKYPDWKELIDSFSEELGLEVKNQYSTEELLSIPQKYYYSINTDDNKYYELLDSKLDIENINSNYIHDLILMMKPSKIITTNFDNLIEKAISKNALFYDVISSDEDVANIKSTNYLLKVHGDLKKRNIVLKEEDYLSYSDNFKLIETLLKSIFATNTIIFIGYRLEDYNMKLILNWVRNLQGENFNTPYFINVGTETLSQLDKNYFESRGLKIIDYREVSKPLDVWEERYKIILEKILNAENTNFKHDNSLDYLYKKLLPLNKLNYLRIEDIQSKLNEDYLINKNGIISNNNDNVNYLEKFNKIYISNKKGKKINKTIQKQCDTISEIFKKGHICGFYSYEEELEYEFDFKYNNFVDFHFNYNMMKKFVENKYVDLDINFKKAYYYYHLCEYEKSYNLYSSLAEEYFKKQNYLKYYFSQINKNSAFMHLKRLYELPNTLTGQFYGYESPSVKNWNEIKMNMSRFDLNEIYEKLPLEFKVIYPSLKNLYNKEYMSEVVFDVMILTDKLENSIKKDSFEMGTTNIEKIIDIIFSHMHFLHENYLILDNEVKISSTIEKLLKSIFSKYANLLKFQIPYNPVLQLKASSKEKINFNKLFFFCIIKYFKYENLKYIFKEYKINEVKFEDLETCVSITKNIFNYLSISKNKKINKSLQSELSIYIRNSIEILKHMPLNLNDCKFFISNLLKLDDSIISKEDKFLFISKKINADKHLITYGKKVIEKIILELIENNINNTKKIDILDRKSFQFINLYKNINDNFHSDKINRKVNEIIFLNKYLNEEFLIRLTSILPKNTVLKIKNIIISKLQYKFDCDILELATGHGLIKNIDIFIDDIIEILKAEDEEIIRFVGFLFLRKMISKNKLEFFENISLEFEFLLNLDEFDYSKFNTRWLFHYTNYGHSLICKNQKAKLSIRNILKEHLKKENFDKKQEKIFLKLYLEIYDL
jgi:hypothetical protein